MAGFKLGFLYLIVSVCGQLKISDEGMLTNIKLLVPVYKVKNFN